MKKFICDFWAMLDGWKTFLICFIILMWAIVGLVKHYISEDASMQLIAMAGIGFGLRSAIGNGTNK
jgi:hypothetical protein